MGNRHASRYWANREFKCRSLMRADMYKVIVERPRWCAFRGKSSHPTRVMRHAGKRDPEGAIAVRGMRRLTHLSRGKHKKQLNENLSPLKRFLHRRVGRRWNDVYSEISRRICPRSAVQLHILQHLNDFVDFSGSEAMPRWPRALWVDPQDGILKHRMEPSEVDRRCSA